MNGGVAGVWASMIDCFREDTELDSLTMQLPTHGQGLCENDWIAIVSRGTTGASERRKGARSPRGLDIAGKRVAKQREAAHREAAAASS